MIDALDVIPDRDWSACISPACAYIGSRLLGLESDLLAFLIGQAGAKTRELKLGKAAVKNVKISIILPQAYNT